MEATWVVSGKFLHSDKINLLFSLTLGWNESCYYVGCTTRCGWLTHGRRRFLEHVEQLQLDTVSFLVPQIEVAGAREAEVLGSGEN